MEEREVGGGGGGCQQKYLRVHNKGCNFAAWLI